MRSIADPLTKDLIDHFSLYVIIQLEAIVIDRNFGYEKTWSITKPSAKMWTHSHNEDHLQVLTPKVIDRRSINKVFDRSLKPLCRCVIQLEGLVIDRNFGHKKMWSITKPSTKMWTHFTQRRLFTSFTTQSDRSWIH